ncbi:PASTA domain-containing protein [Pseudonocardia nantongensis]|uniref:PASTA domain-containing protein n=1 Tax=Pseudonocardia nantongensis TaxID=1181885 RepID=UPI00397B5964
MDGRSQVPELVGLSVEDAHDTALDAGLLAVEQDDADPDAGEWGSTGGLTPVRRVYRQEPSPGKAVATGARVGIWARRPDDPGPDDGGGGGGGGSDLTPTGPAPQSGRGTK